MSTVRVRAFVDRFEDGQTVLLLGDDQSLSVTWPRTLLPDDAGEGTVLEVIIATDVEETADMSAQIRDLLRDLGGSE